MTYKTRLDYYHYAITVFYLTICTLLCLFIIWTKSNAFFVVFSTFMLIGLLLFAYFYFFRIYSFYDNYFEINIGFISKKICYKDIKKTYITKNNISSYATSLKRIAIELKNGKVFYISPKRMDEVLMLLINRR